MLADVSWLSIFIMMGMHVLGNMQQEDIFENARRKNDGHSSNEAA